MQKLFLKLIFSYIILVIIFISLLFLSSLIPSKALKQNIGKSLPTLEQDGEYPTYGVPFRKIILDNYTDSLMLNTAYSLNSQNAINSLMVDNRYVVTTNELNQIVNLKAQYLGKAKIIENYQRYWHGYLIFLRPELLVFSYAQIRMMIAALLIIGTLLFLYFFAKLLGLKNTLFIILSLLFVDFFYLWKSIQFSSVFLIGIFSSIFLLYKYNKKQEFPNLYIVFFIVGGLTSFFDLLTAPLVSLGYLLIVTTLLGNKQNVVKKTFFWFAGYLGLWATKWIIGKYIFGLDAINDATQQILDRTVSHPASRYVNIDAIKLNVFQLIGYNHLDKIIVFGFVIILVLFFLRYKTFKQEKISKIKSWLIIFIIPYIWYLVAANHSYLHVWFTYRDQFLSLFSFFYVYSYFTNWKRVEKDLAFIKSKLGLVNKSTVKRDKN